MRCVEHGLKYIMFYVQKHIPHLAACSGPPLVRDGPLGMPTFVKLAYWTLGSKLQRNLNPKYKTFIHENTSGNNVCEMAAIFCSVGRWVKYEIPHSFFPVNWKICILFWAQNLWGLRFKSSYAFLKRPPRAMTAFKTHTVNGDLYVITSLPYKMTHH